MIKIRRRRAAYRWIERTLLLAAISGIVCAVIVYGVFWWSNSMLGPHDELIEAAGKGDLARVKSLSTFDFVLSRVGFEEHYTPLGVAALAGNIDIVKFLLDKRVDVNVRDDQKQTALELARIAKHPEIEKLILDAGGHL